MFQEHGLVNDSEMDLLMFLKDVLLDDFEEWIA